MNKSRTHLKRTFSLIRELLIEMDRKTGSRRKLAEELRISTHSIQNILKGTNLPDFTSQDISRRRKLAWVRTITRIAASLERDPWELLDSVGIDRNDDLEAATHQELERVKLRSFSEPGASSPVDLLARGLLMSMESTGVSGDRLEKALQDYLRVRTRSSQVRAGTSQLISGKFCRSCMSSLDDGENCGRSDVYCRWCSDTNGELLPWESVLEVMSHWFSRWQPEISPDEARRRAEFYMRAMPAWADSG